MFVGCGGKEGGANGNGGATKDGWPQLNVDKEPTTKKEKEKAKKSKTKSASEKQGKDRGGKGGSDGKTDGRTGGKADGTFVSVKLAWGLLGGWWLAC